MGTPIRISRSSPVGTRCAFLRRPGPFMGSRGALVAQAAEFLERLSVFRPTGRALHADQIVDGTNPHAQAAADAHCFGCLLEVAVAVRSGWCAEAIEGAEVGCEREAVAVE